MSSPREHSQKRKLEETNPEVKTPPDQLDKRAKHSTQATPAKPKLTKTHFFRTNTHVESDESCCRMIYKANLNGASYILKAGSKLDDTEVQREHDDEVTALFFVRLLSPYHEKHPEAYHARIEILETADLDGDVVNNDSSEEEKATMDSSSKIIYGVAVNEIPDFETLRVFESKEINALHESRKLRGYGVATAATKVLNMSDFCLRNVALVDAINIGDDDEESFATVVPHDGDGSFAKKPNSDIDCDFKKTLRDFQSKINAEDFDPTLWPNFHFARSGKEELKCTDDIAREHDIFMYHFLIMPSALLERFVRLLSKHKDISTIDNRCEQLLASQKDYWNIVPQDDAFKKLIEVLFKEGTVDKFIDYLKPLASEFDFSLEEMQSFEKSIREQEAKLRQYVSNSSHLLVDGANTPGLGLGATSSESKSTSGSLSTPLSITPEVDRDGDVVLATESSPRTAATSTVSTGVSVSPLSLFKSPSPSFWSPLTTECKSTSTSVPHL